MQLDRLSRDFRNQLNKQLHSRNSSPAVLISPGLLSRSSPKHLSKALLIMLPHLNNRDMGSTQPSKYKTDLRTVIIIFSKAAGKKSWCPRANEDHPPSKPNFTMSVSLRCPQGTILPTLPPLVLQGVAVSGERISRGPPGNVVALGCLPPLRRVSERSAQTLPVGSPVQDVVQDAHIS